MCKREYSSKYRSEDRYADEYHRLEESKAYSGVDVSVAPAFSKLSCGVAYLLDIITPRFLDGVPKIRIASAEEVTNLRGLFVLCFL